MEREGSFRRTLQNKLRLGSGSSSSLTDLSQSKGSGSGDKPGTLGGPPDESRDKGTQQRRAGANATWNSIHNAVISVFQKKEMGENELYTLNEGVRQLLKTELGSFFTEYLQNQLLTKGMVILRDKIRFYEGQKLLDSLADTWDFFFGDVLSMLQAIFYPVQGKEPSVRQLALLHFRNIIALNLKLDEALSKPRARVPPSIIQMLLILQGVHESRGATDDYLRLERLIQKVVSPYLGTHGLFSTDRTGSHCSSCLLEKRLQPSWSKPGNSPVAKNPVVRSKSYNVPMLTPLVESDPDPSGALAAGVRRHSVSEMTLCVEESESATNANNGGNDSRTGSPRRASQSQASTGSSITNSTHSDHSPLDPTSSPQSSGAADPSPSLLPDPSPTEDAHGAGSLLSSTPSSSSRALVQDTSSGPSPTSSPDLMMAHTPDLMMAHTPDLMMAHTPDLMMAHTPDLMMAHTPDLMMAHTPDLMMAHTPDLMMDDLMDSLDSETEPDGIFLNFRRYSGSSTHSGDGNRQSVA